MSLFRSLRVNGRWVQTDQQDFWQISTTVQDPSVPNYPLETPAGEPEPPSVPPLRTMMGMGR